MRTLFFTTRRLAFRKFEVNDVDALASLMANPTVCRFVGDGRPLPRPEVERWIERSRANVERFGYGTGAVTDRKTDQLLGWGGFARPEGKPEELIYGFAPSRWGMGYGTEFMAGLLNYANRTLGLTVLRATVDPDNLASVRILRKAGFVLRDPTYDGPDTHLYVRGDEETKAA